MSERLLVDQAGRLLDHLRRRLPEWKRKTLEQRLRAGCVRVNGVTVTRNDPVLPGDEVLVARQDEGVSSSAVATGFAILYEDEELIAIDKPAGLLSVSTERQRERTALALLRNSLSRPGSRTRLWPVHRLDRETSGVLLFAKSREARDTLQAAWAEVHKLYLAVVEGHPEPPAGVIDQPLWEDRNLKVRIGPHPEAKAACTRYRTLRTLRMRTQLEVELDSGRRHQIRAHLAWLGHPVVGDARYGVAGPCMGLHALRLVVPHPAEDRRLTLEAPPPPAFVALLAE